MEKLVSTNTVDNSKKAPRGKPFTKGDPRINRHGRPKSFDQVRALFQEIAVEEAKTSDGNTIVVNNHKLTLVEAIARKWATSKDPRLQMYFFEIAFGKVPNNLNIKMNFSDLDKLTDAELLLIANGKGPE